MGFCVQDDLNLTGLLKSVVGFKGHVILRAAVEFRSSLPTTFELKNQILVRYSTHKLEEVQYVKIGSSCRSFSFRHGSGI